jgi:hypothetical protein
VEAKSKNIRNGKNNNTNTNSNTTTATAIAIEEPSAHITSYECTVPRDPLASRFSSSLEATPPAVPRCFPASFKGAVSREGFSF